MYSHSFCSSSAFSYLSYYSLCIIVCMNSIDEVPMIYQIVLLYCYLIWCHLKQTEVLPRISKCFTCSCHDFTPFLFELPTNCSLSVSFLLGENLCTQPFSCTDMNTHARTVSYAIEIVSHGTSLIRILLKPIP